MDRMETVERMQNFIKEHFRDEDFSMEKVCAAAGYSRIAAGVENPSSFDKPVPEGYRAPSFNFGADKDMGARLAVPAVSV